MSEKISVLSKLQYDQFMVGSTHPSGLVLASPTVSKQDARQEVSGIVLPGNVNPKGEIALPKGVELTTSLRVVSDQEIMQYGQKERPSAVKARTSTELARAFHNPALFLFNEVGQIFQKQDSDIFEVLINLKAIGEDGEGRLFSRSAARRKKETRYFYDRKTDMKEEVVSSSPGPLEAVALVAVKLLDEPDFVDCATDVVINPLSSLIRDYRLNFLKLGQQDFPEMPDLSVKLLHSLNNFKTLPLVRYEIYKLFEQLTIPDSLKEQLVRVMDENGDLDHPLAFKLTLGIASQNPDSKWILEQQKRREQLLQILTASNQELFDRFSELLELSRGLVYHGDPLLPEAGKVGMEIEFNLNRRGKEIVYEVPFDDDYRETGEGLEPFWRLHDDMGGSELTRAEDYLSHTQEYVASLADLADWFRDYATVIKSLHLHLDQKEHPYRPVLGGLYEVEVYGHPAIYQSGDYNTWEIRPLFLPKGVGTVHPGRLEDLIGLYIAAASFDNQRPDRQKLNLASGGKPKLEQVIWGHICTYLEDPKGRLSALMALHDNFSLILGCNPISFINSFAESSLKDVALSIEERCRANKITDDEWRVLWACANGQLASEFKEINFWTTEHLDKILNYDPVANAKLIDSVTTLQREADEEAFRQETQERNRLERATPVIREREFFILNILDNRNRIREELPNLIIHNTRNELRENRISDTIIPISFPDYLQLSSNLSNHRIEERQT